MKKICSGVFAVFSLCAILAKADTLSSSGIPSTKIYPREEGKRIVEMFGDEYMPNAFSRYEKARDKALELEQVFTEEFPRPVEKDEDLYSTYEKARSRLFSAVSEYRNAKAILAHFYFLHKASFATSEDLSESDERPLDGIALDSVDGGSIPSWNILETKQAEFAEKFMPETFAMYPILAKEYDQTVKLYDEMCSEREKIGFCCAHAFIGVAEKGREIASELETLVRTYNKLYIEHLIGDIDADELAEKDKRVSGEKHAFVVALTTRRPKLEFFYARAIGLVPIPGRDFMMGRTEVTQAQWESIMGNNPSENKGPDLPVENVSWNDCQEFIKKLNAKTGKKFRLPTEEEWEYACRAGGTGDWGKRANGEEGPLDAMGWYGDNSDDHTHPVGQKEPNAFGLYDMHGNVWEWTATAVGAVRVLRGGGYWGNAGDCLASRRDWCYPGYRYGVIGFRLALSQD